MTNSQGQTFRQQLIGLIAQRDSTRGFTLTELLVVIIIVSVLFGIAAPGWLGFMNRQRVSAAKTEVLQALREAQSLAITKRATYSVQIADNASEVSIFSGDDTNANGATPIKTYTVGNRDNLGKRDASKAVVKLATLPATAGKTVVFGFDGSVTGFGAGAAQSDGNTDGSLYKIVVSPGVGNDPRSCVLVETLLGSMSEGSGNDCDA